MYILDAIHRLDATGHPDVITTDTGSYSDIVAAAGSAAEQRRTTFHATESTVTIGIHGHDAADRITRFRAMLADLVTKHGLTDRVTVAHQLRTVQGADRIVFLNDGRVAEAGTRDELLRHGGRYAAYWKLSLTPTAAD